MKLQNLKTKAAVAAAGLLPALAFAQSEPFDATFTLIGVKAALVITAAWVLFSAVRAPGLIMKVAGKFMNKAT